MLGIATDSVSYEGMKRKAKSLIWWNDRYCAGVKAKFIVEDL